MKHLLIYLVPLALLSLRITEASGQVVINEILSSNQTILEDEDGDYEDWIEIFNTGSEPVSLNGYGLTDRSGRDHFFRWVFPDTTLGAGEFLLVWASGKNRRVPGKPLHTSFRIDRDGEPLRLSDFNGARVDTLPPVALNTDYSYGRYPDGSDDWHVFKTPTPGQPNSPDGIVRLLSVPVFSHNGGFHERDFRLELSLDNAPEGAVIYYTTDGSLPEPGSENTLVYAERVTIRNRTEDPNVLSMIRTNNIGWDDPLNDGWKPPLGQVFKGTVVRAQARAPNAEPSVVNTRTFWVGENLKDRYRLPVVSLSTTPGHFFSSDTGIYVPDNFWGRGESWERPLHFEFYETDGRQVLSQQAGVRVHGGTSRARPIKSLRFYARSAYGTTWFEYPLIPEAPVNRYKRFLLRNSGNDWDQSYFRDALMQKLVEHTGVETQYYRPVIVFLNGEYWGIHNLRKRFDHRYFETMYGIDREDLVILEGNAEIKEGTSQDRKDFLDLRHLLRHDEVNNPRIWQLVTDRIDMKNFRDYHIAQIYFRNTDWPGNNIDFWRNRAGNPEKNAAKGHDGRWRWLLYDTDFGFNLNYSYVQGADEGAGHNTLRFAIEGNGGNHWPNPDWSVAMLRGALRNREFREDFIQRFAGMLNTVFAEEHVLRKIDEMFEVLNPHMDEHIRRWRGPETREEWEADIETMRTFARHRPDAMRAHISEQFSLSGTFLLTLNVNDPAGGYLIIHETEIKAGAPGITGEIWPWTGLYFKGLPLRITAHATEEYRFAGWQGVQCDEEEIILNTDLHEMQIKALFERKSEVDARKNDPQETLPGEFRLRSNYPNPFNSSTRLILEMPEAKKVDFYIYSMDGRQVGFYSGGKKTSGTHAISLDASTWSTGIYLVVARTEGDRAVLPVTLIR